MKKILTILTIVLIIGTSKTAFGQGAVISKYFEKYADNKDYVKVSVSSKMFSLFTEMEGNSEEEKEFLDAISKLKGLRAVVGEDVENADELYASAVRDVDKEGYEELMTVTDAKENVKISIKEKGGIIQELIVVAGGNSEFALLNLYGEIDLKKISKLAGSMKIHGIQHLRKLNEKDDE